MKYFCASFLVLASILMQGQVYYPSAIMGVQGHREYATWGGSASAADGVLRADGKLLLAGTGYWSNCNCYRITMAVVDTACGALDPTFGNGGTAAIQFEGRSTLHDMDVLSNGKVVACGVTAPGNGFSGHKPAVYRLNADGSPDTTFNSSGYRKESFDPISAGAFWRVFPHADGRITCVGASVGNINGGTSGLGAMRFNADGSMDNTFSGDGVTRLDLAGTGYTHDFDLGTGVMLPNGDLLVIGLLTAGGTQTVGMVKIDSTGTIDMNFGTNGLNASAALAVSDVGAGGMNAVLTPAGKVLVSGTSDFSNGEFFVAQFDTSGALDPSYGTGGVSMVAIASNALGRRIELLSDGSTLQYGSANWNNGHARIVKRLPDGSLDATFGNGGIAAPASPTYKKLFGGISLTDGRIMAWGEGSDISLFKFVTDPQADRFADLGPDVIGCQGDSVLLDAGSGYATYAWSTGDSSQAIHASSNSDFIVTLTDQDECMDIDTVAVTMVAPPATPTITVNGLDLSTTATGQLQWYFNGTSIAGATQATHTASANGDYTVTVTDSVGCASASATVTITGVGVQELGRRMISVHPNPTSGPVTVQGVDPASVASITLMDMTGKVTFLEMGRNGMLDVSSMASGVYFLQLIDRQARRATARLVVR